MPQLAASCVIDRLRLARHPEGGWFRESYRSAEQVTDLPGRLPGRRNISTAIYFLLAQGDFSAFHRIRSDEVWHFYAGSGLLLHVLSREGGCLCLPLGPAMDAGEQYQVVVPAGDWFAAEPRGDGFSLVGCTVAPGFDFADFELADREDLCVRYPAQEALIRRLTR